MMVENTQVYVNQQAANAWFWPGMPQRVGQKPTKVSKAEGLNVLKNVLCKSYCQSGEAMFGKGPDKKDREI